MRRSIAVIAATAVLSAIAPPEATASVLSDIGGHWARTHVESAIAAGYVAGYPDGTFRPEAPVTRAEFFKLLGAAMRMEPVQIPTGLQEENKPPAERHWAFAQGHIGLAVAADLLFPPDYGQRLNPDMPITRREIVMAAVRALGKESMAGEGQLTVPDAGQYPLWLHGYAAIALGDGIIQGYEGGRLSLERTATRAEALVMVERILSRVTVDVIAEEAPANLNQVRHPAAGEPFWSWAYDGSRRMTITMGSSSFALTEEVAQVDLLPAPGKAAWVRFRAFGEGNSVGVVARLQQGKLTEVLRKEESIFDLLAVDDDGRLWFSGSDNRLYLADVTGTVLPVEGVSGRIWAGQVDWAGRFWGVGGGRLYRVEPDGEAIGYDTPLHSDQPTEYLAMGEDASAWVIQSGPAEDGAKAEAIQLQYDKVIRRIPLFSRYFGGLGAFARAKVIGHSGPFVWVIPVTGEPGSFMVREQGLYRLNLLNGAFTRQVAPRSVAREHAVVRGPGGGALLRDLVGRFWRVLP